MQYNRWTFKVTVAPKYPNHHLKLEQTQRMQKFWPPHHLQKKKKKNKDFLFIWLSDKRNKKKDSAVSAFCSIDTPLYTMLRDTDLWLKRLMQQDSAPKVNSSCKKDQWSNILLNCFSANKEVNITLEPMTRLL